MRIEYQRKRGEGRQREPQYQKVNAYSRKPSWEQILTIILFLVVEVLYNVFITSAINKQQSSILWVMLAATYILLVLLFVDYCYLTCTDPVDDILLGIHMEDEHRNELVICQKCNLYVKKKSFHCSSCDRCVENFDHHCKYLNNCIGGKNYHSFIRLLISVTFFCLLIIGQGIWIFVLATTNDSFDSKTISRWGVLVCLIFTFAMMVTVDTLLCFHFYLIFVLKKSTLDYLNSYPEEERGDSSKEQVAVDN